MLAITEYAKDQAFAMKHFANPRPHPFSALGLALTTAVLALLHGCSAPPSPPPVVVPPSLPAPPPPAAVSRPSAPEPTPQGPVSSARESKAYRKDAAKHLYNQHAPRIYTGRLPPMLEAVGVLNVDIDQKGQVKAVQWMRAPRHVPHVMAEIENLVKAAAPYPAPKYMSQVTYTEVWLWHKSGKFQLDTLTEGQD